jgi:anaerobic ribonucleoside-triphosphate reductase
MDKIKVWVNPKTYIRVVGYYSEKNKLNKGKSQELKDRKSYTMDKEQ